MSEEPNQSLHRREILKIALLPLASALAASVAFASAVIGNRRRRSGGGADRIQAAIFACSGTGKPSFGNRMVSVALSARVVMLMCSLLERW